MANLAKVANTAIGRVGGSLITAALIPITITLSTTTYATATGGLPFDIAAILNAAAQSGVNAGDVIGLLGNFVGSTVDTTCLCSGFAVGTATYTATPYAGTYEPGVGVLATCPCTVRLYGTGGADDAPFGEIEDADLTGTIVGFLLVSRGGHN